MSVQLIVVGSIVFLGLILNSLVVVSLLKEWSKVKLRHILLSSLAFADLGAALTGFPMQLVEDRETICRLAGYFVSTFSLVSISHIVSLCVERMITLKYPLQSTAYFTSKRRSLILVIPSWLYGILWGTFPWLGWGAYSVESFSRHRCGIDLKTQTNKIQSFNYSLLVFCYIVPIITILACFVVIKKEMRRMLNSAQQQTGRQSDAARASAHSERIFTFIVAVMLISFMLAWTPYAVCVFYVTIKGTISSDVLDTASYLGKCSSFFNPIIYVFMYKDFREALRKLCSVRSRKIPSSGCIVNSAV